MNRKLIVGAVVIVAALVALWALKWRDTGGPSKTARDAGRSGQIAAPDTAKGSSEAPAEAPRGASPTWSLDRDPVGTLPLEGQVIGPDGKGVGGAKIWIGTVPPRDAVTEDDGTFSFDKLVGRVYALRASTETQIGGPITYRLTATSDPAVIRLVDAARVEVTVLDERGQPIVGAQVSEAVAEAKTDAAGKATLRPVSPGWVKVQASAPGYAMASTLATVGAAGTVATITVTLKKGFAVSGKVVDEGGRPIGKAQVTATIASMGWFGDTEGPSSVTDDAGQFEISALAEGSHVLAAIDGEHAPARSTPVTVRDRAVTGITITMKAGGVYAGTVVTAKGAPVPYATVRIAGKRNDSWSESGRDAGRQATTAQDGTFAIRGLARIAYQARAESDDAASQVADVDLSAQPEIKDARLVVDVTGRISGTVVDEKGAPVAEVQVNAFPDVMAGASGDGLALAGLSSATSGGDGNFVITGLPDGAYRLWAARSGVGQMDWGEQGVKAKTGDANVRITLATPGRLVGKLALPDGKTPSIASIQLGFKPPSPIQQGGFALEDLTPGSYDITFRGTEFVETVKADVTIEPGKTTDLGTLTVKKGRRLVGKVVDKAGPVAGAKVRLGDVVFTTEGGDEEMGNIESTFGLRSSITDQNGEFVISGVPAKSTSVGADHPDRGRSHAVKLPAGEDDPPRVTLTLKGYGSVTGKVTMKGKAMPDVQVSASPKDGGATIVMGKTDDTGTFTISKVPEGPVVVQAMVQKMMAMKSAAATTTVVAGKQATANIEIPVGEITLTVELKPLPGHTVDSGQVFLFTGTVAAKDGKQLNESFFQGGAQGMKLWFGKGQPFPEFDELVAGTYSVCSIPITGDLTDTKFQGRLQQHMELLQLYCKQIKVTATPAKQTFVHELPSMTPLPDPPK